MVIGLQGLANRAGPNLYLTYPSNWSFSYTSAVKEYVSDHNYVSFTSLTTSMDVLQQFSSDVDKYVVWDPLVRDTLVVSTATTEYCYSWQLPDNCRSTSFLKTSTDIFH